MAPDEVVQNTFCGTEIVPRRHAGKAVVNVESDRIVKDYGTLSLPWRIAGRFFINREQAALKALEGLEGIPRFLERPNPTRIVMSRLCGEPLYNLRRCANLDQRFPERLQNLISARNLRLPTQPARGRPQPRPGGRRPE